MQSYTSHLRGIAVDGTVFTLTAASQRPNFGLAVDDAETMLFFSSSSSGRQVFVAPLMLSGAFLTVNVLAGSGSSGSSLGTGTAASFTAPAGLSYFNGNVYVADTVRMQLPFPHFFLNLEFLILLTICS